MRRAALALVGTIAGVVALLSFKTQQTSVSGAPAAVASNGAGPGSAAGGGDEAGALNSPSPSPSSSRPSSSSSSSSSGSSTPTSRTVTGDEAQTRFGPVQVRITVRSGKLAGVSATEYPTESPRDQEINSFAIPQLNQEAASAGNAQIDMISGATFTSQGYIESLQSALDKAGL
jgi:uncharacterized protein with FMN-binding domain